MLDVNSLELSDGSNEYRPDVGLIMNILPLFTKTNQP